MPPQDFAARLVRDCLDAVVYADRDGLIGYWNAGAARLFGFAETEAMGASLDLIIPERLQSRHWRGYRDVMGGRASRYADGALRGDPRVAPRGGGAQGANRRRVGTGYRTAGRPR